MDDLNPPHVVPSDQLEDADLIVNALYQSKEKSGGYSTYVLPKLMGVGSGGGFRTRLEDHKHAGHYAYVVIYTKRESPYPLDGLDANSGILTYCGDNKKAGTDLAETKLCGNKILLQIQKAIYPKEGQTPDYSNIPPIFVFSEAEPGKRSVEFIGLAALGNPTLFPTDELSVYPKKPTPEQPQNLLARLSILNADTIPRTWIDDLRRGGPERNAHAPEAWKRYISEGRKGIVTLSPEQLAASDLAHRSMKNRHETSTAEWRRDELIEILDRYYRLKNQRIDYDSPQASAELLDLSDRLMCLPQGVMRSVEGIRQQMSLFAKCETAGTTGGSMTLLQEVWKTFHHDPQELTGEISRIEMELNDDVTKNVVEGEVSVDATDDSLTSYRTERIAECLQRVGQNLFREKVLAEYDEQCCLSHTRDPTLLVASHIVPWAADKASRMDPRNGLCLNTFFDRLYDQGLMTVTLQHRSKFSASLPLRIHDPDFVKFLTHYDDKEIVEAEGYSWPRDEYLKYHLEHIFLDKQS